MDLNDAKKLIAYARRQGIKTIRMGDFEVTFQDSLILEPKKRGKSIKAIPVQEIMGQKVPDPAPTLEQINEWIHADQTEAS